MQVNAANDAPMPDEPSSRQRALLLLIAGSVLIVFCALWMGRVCFGQRFDDPYITIVYARNLVEGNGLVFNAGERIQGFTSPLHVFALAACGFVFGTDGLPVAGVILSAAAAGIGGLLFWGFYFQQNRPISGLLAALLLLTNMLLLSSTGLETSLLVMLVVGSAWAFWRRNDWLAGGLLALAALTRADSVLLAVILCAIRLIQDRRIQAGPLVLYIVIVGAWGLWAWSYFGSPFPNTLAAKQLEGVDPRWHKPLLNVIWRGCSQYPANLLLWAAPLGVVALWRRKSRHVIPIILWGVTQWCAYFLILGVAATYFWYHVPISIVWTLLGVEGLALAGAWAVEVISGLRRRIVSTHWAWDPVRISAREIASCIVLLLVIGNLGFLAWYGYGSFGPGKRMQVLDHHRGLFAVSDWLDQNLPGDVIIEHEEVGIMGWVTRRRLNDLYMLVSTPRTLKEHPPNVKVVCREYYPNVAPNEQGWILLSDIPVPDAHRGFSVWGTPELAAQLGEVGDDTVASDGMKQDGR